MKSLFETELFADLNAMERADLMAISKEVVYKKENVLFFEGDTPKILHYLLQGIVRIYKVDHKGNEVVLHFIQAPSLIAELAHMQHIPCPATAVCETDCTLVAIQYDRFEEGFLKNPSISLKIIASLSRKILNLERVITRNLTMDALARLCRFLYENHSLLPGLSHRKVATILNITPETLSRNLSLLKEQGIVKVQKREIVVLDLVGLGRFFEEFQGVE